MTDLVDLVGKPEDVDRLPVGQWVIAANDRQYCLVDTYVGWPQRMWMHPGGRSHTGIEHIPYPLRLADLDEPDDACGHEWGTQECGHCVRCGRVVAEATPFPVTQVELDRLRAALALEASGDGERP